MGKIGSGDGGRSHEHALNFGRIVTRTFNHALRSPLQTQRIARGTRPAGAGEIRGHHKPGPMILPAPHQTLRDFIVLLSEHDNHRGRLDFCRFLGLRNTRFDIVEPLAESAQLVSGIQRIDSDGLWSRACESLAGNDLG